MAELNLGPRVAPDTLEPVEGPSIAVPSASLTRHAVCFGATGSGKTGLAIVLLEELVRAGVPVIAVDPKGDLTHLARLDAPRSDRAVAGLAGSGLSEVDVADLRERMDVQILTPGSRAAMPVDVLGALARPPVGPDDPEGLQEAVRAAVGSLLGLAGVKADPVRDPRHIVLARILTDAWDAGDEVGLHDVVLRLVDPPFTKVGAFPVDTFLPRSERMDLAIRLNAFLAAPTFDAWSDGTPLDPDALLAAPPGKVAVRVLYVAHLEEAERHLAVGLLLSRLAGWVRRQPGTDDLRCVVLFDEAWGYLPPHPANPPTKRPLLQLLKQARAVGLGVVLATQNPVDLDYKAMSNAGTWFVGRLSTTQDRDRVSEGVAPEARRRLDRLPKRTFWVRRPGEAEDVLLTTRWAMTPMDGPLTLRQVEALGLAVEPAAAPRPAPGATETAEGLLTAPPQTELTTRFLDPAVARSPRLGDLGRTQARAAGEHTVWQAGLLASLHLRFDERGWSEERDEVRLIFPLGGAVTEPELKPDDLLDGGEGRFVPLDGTLDRAALQSVRRTVIDHVFAGETTLRFRHADTGLKSHAGETKEAFRGRVEAALRDEADAEIRTLQAKVVKEAERLEKKRAKLVDDITRFETEAQAKFATEVVNAGETLFGLLFGSRRKSLTTVASKREQSVKAGARVERAQASVRDLEREMYEAEADLTTEIDEVTNRHLRGLDDIDEQSIQLERDDIAVREIQVVWIPVSDPI